MNLKEFVKMVENVIEKKGNEIKPHSPFIDSVYCSVCLKENGDVSQEQTCISLSFNVQTKYNETLGELLSKTATRKKS